MSTGADVIAAALAAWGVRHVFAIVSIHNMPMLDAINRLGATKIIDVRHEQAGTHAADGYARASGEMGVMIASTGPGTTNTVTGLYEAAYASSRVLVITGQAETRYYGKGLSYVHEAEKQVPMLETVARRVESPRHVAQLAPALTQVVQDMHTGRGAPGALEVPIDLQYAEVEVPDFEPITGPAFAPAPEDVVAMRELISSSQRRVIVAGGGVIAAGAAAALTALAEQLDAPVLTTVDGRGALPEDHRLCVGNYYTSAGVHGALKEADLTIAVGTKFAIGVRGGGIEFVPPGKLLQIDIDPNVIGRTHSADLGVHADAALALAALAELDASPNDAQFNDHVLGTAEAVQGAMRKRIGPDFAAIMDLMRARLPRDGLWCRDSTISAYNWGNQLFPVYEPRSSINPSSGAIGPGLPFAIGAVVATGKPGIVIHGDGGFMFHATELATAAQYQLPLVTCVFNDGGYGVLRWLQSTQFGRINETDLGKMNFAKMAESMGMPGVRVGTVGDFEAALDAAFERGGPSLIEIDMEQFEPMEISIMPKHKPVDA